MKKIVITFLAIILVSFFDTKITEGDRRIFPIEEQKQDDQMELSPISLFLNEIGFTESSNNYSITNSRGYLGKYQFHPNTLKMLKIEVDDSTFLNSPRIQEEAMIKLLKYNKRVLKKREMYTHHVLDGKVITESGLLAASHLVGVGNVIKYLSHGELYKDGNGVCMSRYMEKFSGYEIILDKILK
jgi:hypothetical protein